MNTSTHIRLFRASGWKYAHKGFMPTLADWMILTGIMLLLAAI